MRGLLLNVANVAIVVMTTLAAGCSPLGRRVPEGQLAATGEYLIIADLDVPAVRGVEGCGAQALGAVLAHATPGLDARTVAADLPWHDFGATPVDLLLEARTRGCAARIASGTWDDLASNVEAERLTLVMFDAGPEVRTLFSRIPTGEVLHWSVVSGIAADGTRLLLAARDRCHHVVERETFLGRWDASDNCMITVQAPATP